MEQLLLSPINKVAGSVNVPGSKSLSNRALLLAALASGETHLTNLLDSEDIHHMLNALTKLGINYRLSDCKTECWVTGNAGVFDVSEPVSLFLGNAGTAMRPLCAALACSNGDFELTGEPRMEERPIGALVDSLRQAGAEIEYLKNTDYPP
jgi:3-phosphoshikimate 1-carboxyvinyltransferase